MRYSIIVCTYNRARYLELCGDSWAALATPAGARAEPIAQPIAELIIVDNNSTDDTVSAAAALVERINARPGWRARYVFEPKQGLSHARNRGAQEASGAWLAFLDDECIVPSDWLQRLDAHATARAPDMLGGPYRGAFVPAMARARYPRGYDERFGDSHHRRDEWADGWLRKPGLSGGNMAVRADVLERLGGFDPALGQSGAAIAFGEETELQARLLAEPDGGKIYYAADLELTHLIRPEKAAMRMALVGVAKRAKAIADIGRRARSDASRGARLATRLRLGAVCLRRAGALGVKLAAGVAGNLVRGAPVSRALYEQIHNGRIQAVLQAGYAAWAAR